MKKVLIRCPACRKTGYLGVEENLVSKSERGVTAVKVAELLVCEHSFVAYIDRNFSVRDCFIVDFRIELPKIVIEKDKEEKIDIPEINMYLLMINVTAITLTYVIRALLYKQKTCIINDLNIVEQEIDKLIKYSFQEKVDNNLVFVSRSDYKKEKKKYKDFVVIDSNAIINDKGAVMDIKNIIIESAIIQKFLAETNDISSIIILKSEIQKAIIISELLADYLKSHDPKVRLLPEALNEKIYGKFGKNVNSAYLKFLLRISKYYFKTDIAKYLDFLDQVQWLYFIK